MRCRDRDNEEELASRSMPGASAGIDRSGMIRLRRAAHNGTKRRGGSGTVAAVQGDKPQEALELRVEDNIWTKRSLGLLVAGR